MARELVNEPPNVLYPVEFAAPRQRSLRKLGVEVEVLDVKAMTKLGMGALLGVGAGLGAARAASSIMRWNGGKQAASSRSPSSARASASTPAASRSSRPAAWRT